MAESDQTYNVRYNIEVESTAATKQLGNFTAAVEALSRFKGLEVAAENVRRAITSIDKVFKADKSGKKRSYNYSFNIDTKSGEAKLGRILSLVEQIESKSKGINLVINPGKTLDTKTLRKNAETAIGQSRKIFSNLSGTTHDTQTSLTRSVGKINSALTHVERGRELNINTDAAKARLSEILGLLGQIGMATGRGMNLGAGAPARAPVNRMGAPYMPATAFALPRAAQNRLSKAGLTTPASPTSHTRSAQAQALAAQRAAAKALSTQNVQVVRDLARTRVVTERTSERRQRAAINRMQYSRPPSLRNALPFAYMLNGYMLFSTMKSQLKEAVEYANIMESAHSILKVADGDLGTFERRFEMMARNVRQVGIETKFTAVEVGGAVKFLAMAGQNIETINESIRPITNLALIGDNDIAQIADLVTNIMAGYDIAPGSMSTVADIIASTISRSNVNVIETAESFKMAAGYMRMAGIDFSESSAAIGILGNVGLKGSMAGTSLRSIATRLASQPKEAREILDRLGVRFTQNVEVYGKTLEKIRPLADIFEDLKRKGATLGDMTKIFGRWGANAGMALMLNTGQLRSLTADNRASQGISVGLAKVKQQTTKGLWYQMTSTFSEMFMRGFEIMEPQLQRVLRGITASINVGKFSKGLADIATALIDILSLLAKVATWMVDNFRWLEPVIFTGFVATRLFKLAGAVTNLGVAFGFLGKQSAAAAGVQMLTGLVGMGGSGLMGRMTFGDKRNLVAALRGAGVSGGAGALTAALAGAGIHRGIMGLGAKRAVSGMFATQVSTGRGVVGAGAALGALGTTAVAATAGVVALVGALGWVAYKTWKVKEATDAAFTKLQEERRYNYPSIDALYEALNRTYNKAINAKGALDDLTKGKTLQENTGLKIGAWTGNWWSALLNGFSVSGDPLTGRNFGSTKIYTFGDAYRDDLTRAIIYQADSDGAKQMKRVYAELGKLREGPEIRAFIGSIPATYGYDFSKVDQTLYSHYSDSSKVLKRGQKNMTVEEALNTWEYQSHINETLVPQALMLAREYARLMESPENAREIVAATGLDFNFLKEKGFRLNKAGQWEQTPLPANATTAQKEAQLTNFRLVHTPLVETVSALREHWQSGEIAENIMQKAGFMPWMYSNEPDRKDLAPWEAPGISVTGMGHGGGGGGDDGGAGGNYSGTGKLSSAAPKQVIVNITNLLSIETVELLRSGSGNQPEIQDLKEQMARALIDVVHDFDASWNGA